MVKTLNYNCFNVLNMFSWKGFTYVVKKATKLAKERKDLIYTNIL